MKISQKIFISFIAITVPITLLSMLIVGLIQRNLSEVQAYHSTNLYLMQLMTKTTEAVGESFAYIASGHESDKQDFFTRTEEIDVINKQFKNLRNSIYYKDEKAEAVEAIPQLQLRLFQKAQELFKEIESKDRVSDQLFIEYKSISKELLISYQKAIKIENKEVDSKYSKAIKLVETALFIIVILEIATIITAIVFTAFINKSIFAPIEELKLAIVEVTRGNLDTLIETESKDEIGNLAHSFSKMTKELKQYRDELISVKDFINNIINSMSDVLIVISMDGNIITANQAACRLLKYEEEELLVQSFDKICPKCQLVNATQISDFTQICFDNEVEINYVAKNGCEIPVSFSRSCMFDENNQIQAIVCVAQNITRRKQAEEEIKNTIEKEKQLNEFRSRFITMASHEFRTPLTTILSSAELLEHYSYKWSEEKKFNHIQRIQSSVKQMTRLLNDVLLIGKAEAGKLEFKPTLIDISQFCCELVEEMQMTTSDCSIIFRTPEESMGACMMEEKLLRHILTNLLSNAIKYSPEDSVVNFDLICKQGEVIFRIQDQGIGIPEADQAQLFNTFHRASNVGDISGTGLGLAIVKKAVDVHGGTIDFDSKVGVGTTFTVTLPLQKEG